MIINYYILKTKKRREMNRFNKGHLASLSGDRNKAIALFSSCQLFGAQHSAVTLRRDD